LRPLGFIPAGFVLAMDPFSPDRFSQYSKDLSEAIFQMIDHKKIQTRVIGSDRYATMNGKTVMVSATATEQEIATALNMDKIDASTAVAAPKVTALEPIKKNLTGASFLAQLIRTQQASIKKQLADAGTEMTAAITELQDVANEATNQVKAVKAETADLKAALGLNSNGEPE
jgi:hypothetical protein